MSVDNIIDQIEGDPLYIRFLLAESPRIRSAMYARGVCLEPEYLTQSYSGDIGNSLHLDLIEVERWLKKLPTPQRNLVADWVFGTTSRPAYGRAVVKQLTEQLAERITTHD